jgi:hypothetical protein
LYCCIFERKLYTMKVKLQREWELGDPIEGADKGGFGKVYVAKAGGDEAVAKLVPKAPGGERELLFVDLAGARNVVPIIDSGETKDHWLLIMPRAEKSLRKHLNEAGGSLGVPQVLSIVTDVVEALIDLNGRVVHRDIKPENVLLLDGKWCLADFGISRYAEATTAPDTQKYALSPPYAAPERWTGERATAATDIYAVGALAYEMVAGKPPFPGPSLEDYREQHVHEAPAAPSGLSPSMSSLIMSCLYKPAQARPSSAETLKRLERLTSASTSSPGLAKLQEANQQAVLRTVEANAAAAREQTERERRSQLAAVAAQEHEQIMATLEGAILESASEAHRWGDNIMLNSARLILGDVRPCSPLRGDGEPPAFDVIAYSSISVTIPADRFGYEGRSHSLWYCDAKEAGLYRWYETAFMESPFSARRQRSQWPFALKPGEVSIVSWGVLGENQAAWPFTQIDLGDLDEFIDRWSGWFAAAAQGGLNMPSQMPERNPIGSWRQ